MNCNFQDFLSIEIFRGKKNTKCFPKSGIFYKISKFLKILKDEHSPVLRFPDTFPPFVHLQKPRTPKVKWC